MRTVFNGTIFSHYGQAYIHLQDTCDWADGAFKGQRNGLLGTAVPTTLSLTFGLHTGDVALSVRIANSRPEVEEMWEEVVEAPFTMPESEILGLADWNGCIWEPIPLEPGTYRARFTALAFGQGEEAEELNTSLIERYEVTFWRAPLEGDEVIKVTRPAALYWHNVAQGLAR
ncbi:hypothetical protein [Ideonella sp.]|jgi:hypothetical protein|uniref:hypothetical protein n=1 Tax=Ideonella sp. TaxID=1929293 RepID=UPI0037BEED7F